MKHTPILISSLGRCGSTMLWESLDLPIERRIFISDIVNGTFRDNMTFAVKTHDYCPPVENENLKCVYLIGDVFDIVAATWKKLVDKSEGYQHFENFNLALEYYRREKFLDEDLLQLEARFDSWEYGLYHYKTPIMIIRYEDMWEHVDEISKFLGIQVAFPTKRERKFGFENLPKDEQKKVEKTYGQLYTKVNQYRNIVTNYE